MNLKRSIALSIVFAMLGMLACPFVEAVNARMQPMHCHDQAPAPHNARPMTCCSQDAVPVQDSHAHINLMTFSYLCPTAAPVLESSFASPQIDPLFHETGEHLATLSILRL